MIGQNELWTGRGTSVVVNRLLSGVTVIIILTSAFGQSTESTEHLRSYRNGDVMIGMTLPMHIRSSDTDTCSKVSIKSIFVLEALLYVIKSKNFQRAEMSGLRFGYDVRDTCFSISTGMKQGLNFLTNIEEWSKARVEGTGLPVTTPVTGFPIGTPSGMNTTKLCREKPVMGIVGPSGSSVSIALAGLMSLYKIPLVSYFSTSTALKDRLTYPSFYRTIPSDDKQTVAMAEMITRFKWNYISTIATDNEYGREGIEALKTEIAFRNICLARDDLYDPTAGKEQVETIISALKKDERVKVIILFMYWQHAKLFLDEAQRQNLTDITWIASESWSSTHEMLQLPPSQAKGIIGISVPSYYYPDFQGYVQGMPLYRRVKSNPWLALYVKSKFKCNLIGSSGGCPKTAYDPMLKNCSRKLTLGDLLETNETLSVTVNAANALLTFIEAMKTAIKENKDNMLKEGWFKHEDLNRYIAKVNFTGAGNEQVRFDENGDFIGADYFVLNVQERNGKLVHVKVGEWKMDDGPGKLTLRENEIQWNGDKKPKSRCSTVCQAGYLMRPSPSECCWDCRKCPVGTISNKTQSTTCYKCDMYFHTNAKQSKCLPNAETWVYHYIGMHVAILAMGAVGILTVLIILIIIIVFRHLALIRRTELKYTFLLVTFCGQLFPFLYTIRPAVAVCAVQTRLLIIPAVFHAVILFCQTELAILLSGRLLRRLFHKKVNKTFVQVLTFFALGLIGMGFCMLSFSLGMPSVQKTLQTVDVTFLSCEDPYRNLGTVPIVFQALLLMVAAFFFEREKDGLRHSAYNCISCYILVLISAVTIPAYVMVTDIQTKIIILSIGNTTGLCAITGLKFVPQMYDIFIKKNRDIFEADITLNTDSSQVSNPDAAQKGQDAASAQQKRDSKSQPPVRAGNDDIPMTKLKSASQREDSGESDVPRDPGDVRLQVPEIIVDHDENRSNLSASCIGDSLDVVRDSRESLPGSDLQVHDNRDDTSRESVPVQVLTSHDNEQHTAKSEVFV